ncbi:FtsX-like permease family protein [Plantactinospora sp. WMMB782]|uniref:FtsX-like permease family protein n=1 Tax=Plantactinospora sp. WMMB782 TaxID=3404121 RepID=UPI003B93A5EB
MDGLWLRLLRGSGRSARLEVGLPVVAGGVITFVLLILLGLQQGLDNRADRTAWRTPDSATSQPTAVQGGFTDYVGEQPLAVVELAALTREPPAVPGMGRFPAPGEVWASPALAELMAERPADQLADRFPGPVTAELGPAVLEGPDELVAVVGRHPDDPSMTDDRAPHQWNRAASMTPTRIDGWSTTPDLYQTTYRDLALLAVVLTALPLSGLGGLASRLMAGRRHRRLATLRLLGATTSQVARLTVFELATFTGAGAVCGALLHRIFGPTAARVPIKGGGWFPPDVTPGVPLTVATVVAVVVVLTLGALVGLLPAVRDPLATYRAARPRPARTRWWSVVFIGAAVALFWIRSSNTFVSVGFTAVVVLGWGLVSTGPWIVAALGRLLAGRAQRPATLLAGRRLSDSPQSAWRTVAGMALASFVAGFAAAGLPVGLGNAGQYAAGKDRLEIVVPADSLDATVQGTEAVLRTAAVRARVEATAPPSWLDDRWGALALVGPESTERDLARTAMIEAGLWGPEMRMAEDLPTVWLVRDGTVIGLLVLPIAALVALTSMVVGAIARIFDQRETLIALNLAGTPQPVLLAAQRREVVLPTAVLGGTAAVAGLAAGSSLGAASLLNPYSLGIFAGLLAVGATALLLADRTTRPILRRVSTSFSERP